MDTPICDFVRAYAGGEDVVRLHMPGHKGEGPLGAERWDITEIPGADSLYEAGGIIARSEANAGELFGCPTLYSTEGSSQCIRAMLYLAVLCAGEQGRTARIAAGRNAHKTFLTAAALLDLDVTWLCPGEEDSYLSCTLTADGLEEAFARAEEPFTAVYVTSPDYLGHVADVAALAAVCRKHGALLLVDNAHGAYLRFLPQSLHPMDLGADLCCDSAHKTLGVLTGGAYLHLAAHAPEICRQQAKQALALFGSTSPSYLILQSLDAANAALAGEWPQELARFALQVEECKTALRAHGFTLTGEEPMKLTLCPKPWGYTGGEAEQLLREQGIVSEFSDGDHLVLMFAPQNGTEGLERLRKALLSIPRKEPIPTRPPRFQLPRRVCSVRQAVLAPCEEIPVEHSVGRVAARPGLACPPAVAMVVCGEEIDAHALELFAYYGVETCFVIKQT